MRYLRAYFFYFFWFTLVLVLGYVAAKSYRADTSILAQVEPQKFVVSFQKPVRIKKLFVVAGQNVNPGDTLVLVERMDLVLDIEKKLNDLQQIADQRILAETNRDYQLEIATINYQLRNQELDLSSDRLNLDLDNQNQMKVNIKKLSLVRDTLQQMDNTDLLMRLKQIEQEKQSVKSQFILQTAKANKMYNLKVKELDGLESQFNKELELLRKEELSLIQIAKQKGTIGAIYAQMDELIPSFANVISIYDKDPKIIRALVHERQSIPINPGDLVTITSTNRDYETTGVVKEVGSRIIEYPTRLKVKADVLTYGRELFVAIDGKSQFLNGEKVYVKVGS